MSASVERRLTRLETVAGPTGTLDLAAILEAARKRAASTAPAELRRESERRLAEMHAAYAVRPYRGRALRMMRGLERVHAADVPPVPSLEPPMTAPARIDLTGAG